jgi:hypothetical protein
MYCIATLANKNALDDLKVFFFTLQLWNNNLPKVYIYCDSVIEKFLREFTPYKGVLFIKNTLDVYNGYNRAQMEKMPGKEFPSMFGDFVIEKTHLMDWAFETEKSVLFCDADICFLSSLPMITKDYKLGVSRHNIRTYDENRFGIYNAGFLYASDKTIPGLWKEFSKTSRFFEQIAIENLVQEFCDSYFVFSNQNNYGWWRLLQGKQSVDIIKSKWSIHRMPQCSGICVEGEPLLSVHTHWKTNDAFTTQFNVYVLNYLEKLKTVNKSRQLLHFLNSV